MKHRTPNHTEDELRRAADWTALVAWMVAPNVGPIALAGVIAAAERLEAEPRDA